MNLKSISLENFRIFNGKQRMDFNNKDLNVIVGDNATGKSTIVDAIKWCLYGEGSNSMLNFNASELNDSKTLAVSCAFEDGNDIYLIERSIIFDEKNMAKSTDFCIMVNENVFANPYSFINDKFPKEIYGCDLVQNSLNDNIDLLKRIIYKEYGIEELKTIINNLNKLQDKYINEIRKIKPNIGDSSLILENKLDKISMKIHDIDDNIKMIKNKIKICELELNLSDINNLLAKRNKLEKEFARLHVDAVRNQEKISLLTIKQYPLAVAFSGFISSNNSLSDEDIESLLINNPNLYKDQFLKNYFDLKNNLSMIDCDEIKHMMDYDKDMDDKIDMVSEELNEIDSKLSRLDSNGFKEYDNLRALLEKRLLEKGNLVSEKKYLTNKLKNHAELKYDSLSLNSYNDKIEFISCVISSIEKLMVDIDNHIHQKSTDSINDYFLNHLDSGYDEVKLDYDFNIKLVKSNIKINPCDLSRGEMQILNLSLILAIEDLVDDKFPLILDTPLSGMDYHNKNLILDLLKNNPNQTILLLNTFDDVDISGDYVLKHDEGVRINVQ